MIKINLDGITDDHKYKDLAFLLDNSRFQKDLSRLQKIIKKDAKKYPHLANYLLHSTGQGEAWSIARKYKYPGGFTRAIFTAASSGRVTDNDVENCYSAVLMHPSSILDEYRPVITKEDLVVFIHPNAIKGNKQAILKQVGRLLNEAASNIKPLSKRHPISRDVRSNIRQVREWYWEKILNKVKTRVLAKHADHEENTIDKATSQYSKLVNSEF